MFSTVYGGGSGSGSGGGGQDGGILVVGTHCVVV